MTEELWTLAELADRVAAALSSGYDGQQNRRITDVPDTRAIRYYTTIGLLDRPAEMRGRTALYGDRHLWQLVSIKRLQADGRSLTDIQAELAGASDQALQRLAALPTTQFWKRSPAPPPPATNGTPRPPGAAAAPTKAPSPETPGPETPGPEAPQIASRPAGVYQTVALDDGTLIMIPRRDVLDDQEIADIRTAAAPLTSTLRRITEGTR